MIALGTFRLLIRLGPRSNVIAEITLSFWRKSQNGFQLNQLARISCGILGTELLNVAKLSNQAVNIPRYKGVRHQTNAEFMNT